MAGIVEFALAGQHVVLEPLSRRHVADLVAAASEDRQHYRWTTVPDGSVAMQHYVDEVLAHAAAGTAVPFVQRRRADGAIVGCTRFMTLAWWRQRDVPDEVEIGGTWLAASAQRGPINTEAKALLLTHAFETWGVVRVMLCTDARNSRSRAAIERIGARFEGVLRNHRASHVVDELGQPRDTAVFAVTDGDWPAVREHLAQLRARSLPAPS